MRIISLAPGSAPVVLASALALVGLGTVGCGGTPPEPETVGTSRSAVTVCGETSVNGMDVSHYDGTIEWPTAKASGIDFAYVKATESTDFVDPMFATNWAGMKAAGVVRGAYHFFHADVDPVMQADFVVSTVGTLEPGDLPIVLDLETANGETESVIAANAATFLSTVSAATGVTAIVYVSPSFLSSYTAFAGTPLWVANWDVSCPDVPAPWSTWTFWQSSSTGTVSGVSGASAVDLDTFNGTLAQLTALGAGGGAPPKADAGTPPDAASTSDAGTPVTGGDSGVVVTRPEAGTTLEAGTLGGGGAGGSGGHASSGGNPPADSPTDGAGAAGGCSVSKRSAPGDAWAFAGVLLAIGAALRRRATEPNT